jgi:hypothetical protein
MTPSEKAAEMLARCLGDEQPPRKLLKERANEVPASTVKNRLIPRAFDALGRLARSACHIARTGLMAAMASTD